MRRASLAAKSPGRGFAAPGSLRFGRRSGKAAKSAPVCPPGRRCFGAQNRALPRCRHCRARGPFRKRRPGGISGAGARPGAGAQNPLLLSCRRPRPPFFPRAGARYRLPDFMSSRQRTTSSFVMGIGFGSRCPLSVMTTSAASETSAFRSSLSKPSFSMHSLNRS